MTSRHNADRQEQILEFMLERRVDGIIYADWTGMSEKIRRSLIGKNIPVAYLFQYPENQLPRSGYSCVNAEQVGYLAIRHLLDSGHRHIACVGVNKLLRQCVRQALVKVKVHGRKKIEYWPWESPCLSEKSTFDRWLESTPRPTALFFFGDEVACQILNLAVRHGIKIPQDLALIGVDDIPQAAQAAIPLTTVSQPKYQQGWAAAEILFDLIDGKPGREVIFQPELIRRQTT
jgi:LacI family transcriptional regulator